jgi:hypothetical protein
VSHAALRQHDFTTLQDPVLGLLALDAVCGDHEGFASRV